MRFSDIFQDTVITLGGEVDEHMIRVFDKTLKDLHADPALGRKATILLTTYGGASGYAMGMFERLRLAQASFDLTIVGLGVVYSHGVTLLMAFPKERRFVSNGTRLYIHELQRSVKLSLEGSHSARRLLLDQERETFREEQMTLEWMVQLISDGCGRDPTDIRERLVAGAYFSGDEAVKFGLAGALVDESAEAESPLPEL